MMTGFPVVPHILAGCSDCSSKYVAIRVTQRRNGTYQSIHRPGEISSEYSVEIVRAHLDRTKAEILPC